MSAPIREEIKRISLPAERPRSLLDNQPSPKVIGTTEQDLKPNILVRIKLFFRGNQDLKQRALVDEAQPRTERKENDLIEACDVEERIALSMGHEGLRSPLSSEESHASDHASSEQASPQSNP